MSKTTKQVVGLSIYKVTIYFDFIVQLVGGIIWATYDVLST